MTILDASILGLVEGVTEFLPVSSTGHLILAGALLGLPDTGFQKTFDIAIQLGAIAAVPALYFRSFLSLPMLKKLVVGFVPTGIIGLLVYPYVKEYLLGNEQVVLWALALGGAALIAFELWYARTPRPAEGAAADITYKQSLCIGLFQAVAVIPGVSRSAATILGGLSLGIPRAAIVEFSFLLAVPTMLAATGLDLLKSAGDFSRADFGALGVGFAVSFVVAILSMRFLLSYVRRYSFIPFGVYRIAAAILFFLLVLR
jgi:undecaprenyl-diphosphatase